MDIPYVRIRWTVSRQGASHNSWISNIELSVILLYRGRSRVSWTGSDLYIYIYIYRQTYINWILIYLNTSDYWMSNWWPNVFLYFATRHSEYLNSESQCTWMLLKHTNYPYNFEWPENDAHSLVFSTSLAIKRSQRMSFVHRVRNETKPMYLFDMTV